MHAFNRTLIQCLRSVDYIVVFENEDDVINADPNMILLSELDLRGVMITSRSKAYDFVTRCFAPKYGINEDPVTGSAFTQLIPYWKNVVGKSHLNAKQVSKRGGEVNCVYLNERVLVSGKAARYRVGEIEVNE